MQLEKTVIIPTDDKNLAQELFKSVIYDEDVLVVVVLGDDEEAKEAAKKADKVALWDIQGRKRKVLWVRNKELLKNEIEAVEIGDAGISKEDLYNAVAFSISLGDVVADIIKKGDKISLLRMDLAFNKAL